MADDKLERNKAIVRKMLDAFNTGDSKVVQDLLHPNIKDHSRMLGLEPTIRNAPVVRRVQTEIMREKEAFPDKRFKEELIVAEGDTVVLRWSMTGTHKGNFVGKAGTGKPVAISGTEFVKIQDGKIVEHDDDPLHVIELLSQLDMLTPDVLQKPEFAHDRVNPRRHAPGGPKA
jgi:predicted ester cyclase